ncbi:MAG TPA: hypothetical protein DCY48_01830 [Candidatus Magasanikbacteria bacterium]|nr:MAG: hypothetical protein A3I74_00740 [Candidatus Magasanikbacteria bacterium RIFCSPLOWO2_02_FULL_47_16]OGH80026.1 MAG: hypothetical protein A3C10_02485 [Candidatus Magasanikbacteria bacterium RIFCSPHIGHO2_02_FULL_48_18]OGH83274.1 MAG: hypothetical protein A3G08_02490 [Candidatus Magasanikbacteria bacterium RIFCSPLOWO2_12_FULL_47_9b]HAZ28496.1 hypothetical protein [Candidatus Magasanikbacteria bacterium]
MPRDPHKGRGVTPFDGIIDEMTKATGLSREAIHERVFARANEIADQEQNYAVPFLLARLREEYSAMLGSLRHEADAARVRAGGTPYDDIIHDIAETLGATYSETKKRVFAFLQTVMEQKHNAETAYLRGILEKRKAEMIDAWRQEIQRERDDKKRRHAEGRHRNR